MLEKPASIAPPITTDKHSFFSRTPLWAVLIIPFVTIIITVTGVTEYLSSQNSRRLVEDMVMQLLPETDARIESHLANYLEVPRFINETNANAIQNQQVDISNEDELAHYFWGKVQVYNSVSSIYFGNPQGGLVSGGREGADGSFYIITTENFAKGPLSKYATDAEGNPAELLVNVPEFDSRIRPWYQGAVERGNFYWTSPYVLSTGQDLAIAASLPIYDENGELLGVTSVDLFISQVNDFLRGLQIGKTGQAYIVEHSGMLVASSTAAPSVVQESDSTWRRISAQESEDLIIADSARQISEKWGGFDHQNFKIPEKIEVNGDQYYLWVTHYPHSDNLDWVIVLTIPEDDFLAQIKAQNRITFMLTMMAVMFATMVGILIAVGVVRPIGRLSVVANALAKGNWGQDVPREGVKEIQALARSFDVMRVQLHETFSNLEDRVSERTCELEASQAKYRAIVEDQTELICRFLPDATLTFVNGAYSRYYDKTPNEMIGKSFLPNIPREDHPMVQERLAQLNRAVPTVTVRHQVIKSDGQLRWVEWVNRALFDEAGKIIEIQAVGRDITESIQYEDVLRKALARETELHIMKSQFISTVSHEFRTPISIISTSSEIIRHYGDRLEAERKKLHFNRIQEQVQRMVAMLEDVLTINQADQGKMGFSPERFDITDFFQVIINEIQTIAPTGTVFDFDTVGSCSMITADRKLLRLIITNLISNAAKYSLPNSHIKIDLVCGLNEIRFSVQDEGIGIPADVQLHIFEPFYRATNVDTIPGTGLGLAIVKQSIEQYGGTISFQSEEGIGTTFTVTLPLSQTRHSE